MKTKIVRIYFLTVMAVASLVAILPDRLADPLANLAMATISWLFGSFVVISLIAAVLLALLSVLRS